MTRVMTIRRKIFNLLYGIVLFLQRVTKKFFLHPWLLLVIIATISSWCSFTETTVSSHEAGASAAILTSPNLSRQHYITERQPHSESMIENKHDPEAKTASGQKLKPLPKLRPLKYEVSKKPPPGFENITTSQTILVDVYFDNEFLLSTPATIDNNTIQFLDANLIALEIKDLLEPHQVVDVLSAPLPVNTDQVCFTPREKTCATPETDNVTVVFDEKRNRADLFIHPDFLVRHDYLEQPFLGQSDSGFSLLQNLRSSASGNINDLNYTVYGQTLLGYNENHIRAAWDFGQGNTLRATQLLFERDYQGRRLQAGLIDHLPVSAGFASSERTWGISYSSSERTRLDKQHQKATPLEVFLPLAGRVEIYRDDRLLQSHYYPAGNQRVDTRFLPEGAYNITIKIVGEQGQLLHQSEQFYVKSTWLPAFGIPDFFIQAGYEPTNTNESFIPGASQQFRARSGLALRANETTGLIIAGGYSGDESYIESGMFYRGSQLELNPSWLVGQQGMKGISLNLHGNLRRMSYYFNYQQVWQPQTTVNSWLGKERQQVLAGISAPLKKGNWNYNYNRNQYSDFEGTNYEHRHTLGFFKPLYSTANLDISLRSMASYSSSGNSILLSLDLRQRKSQWRHQAKTSAHYSDNTNKTFTPSISLSGDHDEIDLGTGTLAAGYEVNIEENKRILGNLDYKGRPGSVNGSLSHTLDRHTRLNINASTNYARNTDASIVGGRHSRESAILVEIQGAEGEHFDILINNRRKAVVAGNRKTLIPLTPFEQYQLRIRPRGYASYNFDNAIRQINLYPGNIVTATYTIDSLQILLARVTDSQGTPLINAELLGKDTSTNLHGLVQLEAPDSLRNIKVYNNGQVCSINLPERPPEPFVNLGELVCL